MSTILKDIAIEDVQKIISDTVSQIKGNKVGTGILFFDVSYLYSFAESDMHNVSRICKLGRYDIKHVYQWHNALERWNNDQTVSDLPFKPLQIRRNLDRIVNEGLEMVAGCITGQEGSNFHFHGIGEGEDPEALPSDTTLVDQISRIDINKNADGGSVSRDGSTIYFVGNHPSTLATAEITETGVFDAMLSTNDHMLDHSVFDPGIDHDQFETSAGSTTVVYMCGI